MTQKGTASPLMVLITVGIAQFMAPFMVTSIGVALPSLGKELHASAMQLGLIEQLYVVSMAMGMLTAGRYGDIVGQRKVFLPGLILFSVLTCSLGFAQNTEMIMIQRFFQGMGACMMLSGSLALVTGAFPVAVRGRMIGIVSACTYAGLSMGPVIGGLITDLFGWRAVFWLSAPLGILATACCLFGMAPAKGNAADDRMDWRGGMAYAVSVGLIMLGSAHAREIPLGPVMIVLGILGLVVFIRLQARTASPLISVALLTKNRYFSFSCLAALGNYASTFGITFMLSLYLQYVLGLSPQAAGGLLLVQPVVQIIVSPFAGQLADKFEPARLATIGMLISAAGLLAMAFTVDRSVPLWLIGTELAVIGAGFGIFITPNSTAIMSSVEKRQFGLASGMVASMRTLGMAVSMTSITLIISLFMGKGAITPSTVPAFLTSMRTGLVLFSIYACLGVLVSFERGRRKNKDSAAQA